MILHFNGGIGRNGVLAPSTRKAGADESGEGHMPTKESKMAKKAVKVGRPAESVSKEWEFFTTGGDSMGFLTYTKREIKLYFPDAKIKKDCVYL